MLCRHGIAIKNQQRTTQHTWEGREHISNFFLNVASTFGMKKI